ncbi:hypothetical protein Mapa_009871 [Marchantia paleacea]|nr:hypothetical protein Mapa_009871 [Marchantia paleacea]
MRTLHSQDSYVKNVPFLLMQFLKTQSPDKVSFLLQTRVFPLYTMGTPSPYVLANANWLLGELAACLPEELNEDIYNALLKALLAPNVGDVSWRPVRASAAGALSTLLQVSTTLVSVLSQLCMYQNDKYYFELRHGQPV